MMLNRMPAVGDTVQCPADRGEPAFTGKIEWVGITKATNIHGVRYVWCAVRNKSNNRASSWASHRLGYKLPE